jgi:hypothetical protein
LSRSFRVLAAAFAVSLASLGGALYLTHERVTREPEAYLDAGPGVAALDLHDMLASADGGDQRMLDSAFRQVEKAYYKPVDAQTLLTGERRELTAYLKKHGIADPAIPELTATGDEESDTRALNKDLEVAQTLYGKRTSDTELTQAAIRGMLDSLGDPYTTYLSPKEIQSLEESLKGGDFGGIGVYIVQDPHTKQVLVEPIDGTPADKAGVKTGDTIVAVDGHPVATLKLDEVENLIRGRVGSVVQLRVKSRATKSIRTLAITRDWPISDRPRTTKCARPFSPGKRTVPKATSSTSATTAAGSWKRPSTSRASSSPRARSSRPSIARAIARRNPPRTSRWVPRRS